MANSLKSQALRCLTRREYSREELRRKLAPGAESAEALESVLTELQSRRLLSDTRYAAQRVSARSGRYGNQRLARELQQQGVAEDDIDAALAESDSEISRCHQVWLKKFGTLPADRESLAKQQRFLVYRGFSADAIRQVLKGLEDV